MRDGSGIEATAQLNRSHPDIAVLILSMHDKLEYVSQAMQAGARGYVLKDAPGKDIVLAIDTVMAGGIYYSEALARKLARPQVADAQLTAREHEVLARMSEGLGNRAIAQQLHISTHTAKFHVAQIIAKLAASSRAHAVAKALRAGLVEL
jgi:DNA-binding NarL/FixJ family response regulator